MGQQDDYDLTDHFDKTTGRAASLTPAAPRMESHRTRIGGEIKIDLGQPIDPRIGREGAAGKLLDERGSTHGDYDEGARTIQGLKNFFHRHAGWNKLSECQKESIDMFATKLGRILAGNPNEVDHWKDLTGYAQLIVERLS